MLSPLLFIIALEALSSSFRTGLPWELLYADDLVLIAESIAELENLYERWKSGMEMKGLHINIKKTKVMCSKGNRIPLNKGGKTHVLSVGHSRVKNIVCKRCLGEIPSVSESEKVRLIDDNLLSW